MIPLLFAAALTLSGSQLDAGTPSPILKDLRGPLQQPLGAVIPAPLLKDLRGQPATGPLAAPQSWILKIAPGGGGIVSVLKSSPAVQCQNRAVQTSGSGGQPVTKLGDLPPGLEEHAVNRMVNGCPVREIVSGGRTYYLDMPMATLDRVDPTKFVAKQH